MVSCKVHQIQRARLKSPTELLYETTNIMAGVPFAESFTVESKWRFTEEDGKSRIKSWVNVDFKKSIIGLQGKIERSSIEGTSAFLKNYTELLRSKFKGDSPESSNKSNETVAKTAPQSKGFGKINILVLILSALVLIVSVIFAVSMLRSNPEQTTVSTTVITPIVPDIPNIVQPSTAPSSYSPGDLLKLERSIEDKLQTLIEGVNELRLLLEKKTKR